MKRSLAAIGIAIVTLAACGGDDDGSGLTSAQSDAAAAAMRDAEASGIELDESCVNEVAAKLTEEDAAKIVAADPDDVADLSPEGEVLGAELLRCVDQDALIGLYIDGLQQSGQSFDEACLRENLADIDVAEFAAASVGDEPPAELVAATMECLDTGG